MSFKMMSSPHTNQRVLTSKVMLTVALCTLPALSLQTYFFGLGSLIQVLLCSSFCCLFEAVFVKIRKKDVRFYLKDYSALLTGLLLGLSLPAYAPWWIALLGSGFSMIIVKHLYGGLGNNIFNPAMAGYVFLLVSFPVQMTSWIAPLELSNSGASFIKMLQAVFLEQSQWVELAKQNIDGVTMATPLDTLRTDLRQGLTTSESLQKPVFNELTGIGWGLINLAYACGGLLLLRIKMIRWHIPAAMLGSLIVCSSFGFMISPDTVASPLIHLTCGATMLGAFFIATDPVSASTSNKGRLIYGALIGVLMYLIRTYGGYPDAVAFAVILANLCVPLIDHYVRPIAYGHARG